MNNTRDEKILKRFGSNLKSIRKTKRLSLRKLADIVAVGYSQIHRIEKGESNPILMMVYALAEALNIKISELLIS
ncbi:MAG: Helix-turn-helix protein [Chitinophagaceae bacterium]|nr:Helix-turn-helix protein [Chitinophagaceae bacterium]MDB5222122.1 Helix-turn-helix protein [Chitinophagaceae bacterium]